MSQSTASCSVDVAQRRETSISLFHKYGSESIFGAQMITFSHTRTTVLAAALLTLLISPAAARAQRINPIISNQPQTVTLEGVVKDPFGNPLGAAEVFIANGPRAISNSRGEFALLDVPAGAIRFTSRRIGYVPTSTQIEVGPGAVVHLAVKLVPVATQLGTIVVEGKKLDKALWQTGFYQRRDAGLGTYFDSEFMKHWHSGIANLAGAVPTIQVARKSNGIAVAQARLPSGNTCNLSVFVDGNLIPWATSTGFDDIIRPEDVLGVEVYPTASEMPAKIVGKGGTQGVGSIGTVSLKTGAFGTSDPSAPSAEIGGGFIECGAMLIWTKPFDGSKK